MKEFLPQKNVNYVYIDITSGMLALKRYLKIRDFNNCHKEARKNGTVGIPTLSVDEKTYVLSGKEDAERLVTELELIQEA